MANATAHRIGAAVAVGAVLAHGENEWGEASLKPIAGAGLAAVLGTLPDKIEPAIHPHHRQFFHSFAFASLLGAGMYRLYKWEPEEAGDKLLRDVLLIAGGAYLAHLAMDAVTSRSLHLVGKL